MGTRASKFFFFCSGPHWLGVLTAKEFQWAGYSKKAQEVDHKMEF